MARGGGRGGREEEGEAVKTMEVKVEATVGDQHDRDEEDEVDQEVDQADEMDEDEARARSIKVEEKNNLQERGSTKKERVVRRWTRFGGQKYCTDSFWGNLL